MALKLFCLTYILVYNSFLFEYIRLYIRYFIYIYFFFSIYCEFKVIKCSFFGYLHWALRFNNFGTKPMSPMEYSVFRVNS